ncbi:MAG: hypothetical protein JWO09_1573 [Bacteroidetes bacterium]|nr:hypothetical protein [Bacteroidota bacterium]
MKTRTGIFFIFRILNIDMKKLLLLFAAFILFYNIKAQTLDWAKSLGGTGADNINDIVYDSAGNVYTTGSFQNTVDFDPGPGVFNLSSAGYYDLFVQKLDASGNLVWAKSIGSNSAENGNGIALDMYGNIYVTGDYYSPTVDFDPGPGVENVSSLGSMDAFILKLDAAGNFNWVKTISAPNIQTGVKLVTDPAGNIYISGTYYGTADFDPGPGVYNLTSAGSGNFFAEKLNSIGDLIWARSMGSAGNEEAHDIALDKNNNVLLSGLYTSSADLDPGPDSDIVSGLGNWEIYIVKLDSSGNYTWGKSISSSGPDIANSIAVDDSGSVYVTGFFSFVADFNPGPGTSNLASQGNWDIFVEKLDSSGNFVWAKSIGSPGNDEGNAISTDLSGNIYITGRFSGTADFDPGLGTTSLTASGASDAFVEKLDPSGNLVWVHQMGGTGSNQGYAVAVSLPGMVYAAGYFQSATDFDPGPGSVILTSAGATDAYLTKWSQGYCDNLTVVVDYASNAGCSSNGFAYGHALNGIPPYSYSWNTAPIDHDSAAAFSNSGIYNLTAIDSVGCTHSSSVLINGPTSQTGYDLNINFISTPLRPNRTFYAWFDNINTGCVAVSGTVMLVLDTMTTYISSVIFPPDSISPTGDSLFWNFTSMPYSLGHVFGNMTLKVSPLSHAGDVLCFDVYTNPLTADANPYNNVKTYCFPVVNSWDPNVKNVYPPGECSNGYVSNGQLLSYTVRFQNTGSADAIDIYVLDTLDADLDINSVHVISSSHSMFTEILPGNVLKFRFDNIHLPDSTSNEPGSHGYVIYEVMPVAGLSNATQIRNKAGIYFDFNPPVYTNEVLNTISDGTFDLSTSTSGITITANLSAGAYQWIDCSTGDSIAGATAQNFTPSQNGNYAVIISDGCYTDTSACVAVLSLGLNSKGTYNAFSIYPNPANSTITVKSEKATEIRILNMLGEVLMTRTIEKEAVIDISQLANGIYFIQTTEGTMQKLVRQ